MDREEFEDKLADVVTEVMASGFYQEDLGSFAITIDYREDNTTRRTVSKTFDPNYGEPAPIPNGTESIHDMVVADILAAMAQTPELEEQENKQIAGVIAELRERRRHGLEKYGTILQAHNGRSAVRDALDEALDLIVYIKQASIELTDRQLRDVQFDSMYRNAIEFAIALKYLLINLETENDSNSRST